MDEQKYLPPLDPGLALRFRALDDDLKEWFTERAAIREFMAEGVSRRDAERGAWADLVRHFGFDRVSGRQGDRK